MDIGKAAAMAGGTTLLLVSPIFFFLAPTVPGWNSAAATGTVYSYVAGSVLAAALLLTMVGNQTQTNMLTGLGIFVSLPGILFAALAAGVVLEFDIDPGSRYILAEKEIPNWTFLVAGIATLFVATSLVLHWPTEAKTDKPERPLIDTALSILQFGTGTAAAVEAGIGELDDIATGLSAGSAGAALLSLGLLGWFRTHPDRTGVRPVLVASEMVMAVTAGLGAGYLYQLGDDSAGVSAEAVAWILTAALCLAVVRWSVFHWNLARSS